MLQGERMIPDLKSLKVNSWFNRDIKLDENEDWPSTECCPNGCAKAQEEREKDE